MIVKNAGLRYMYMNNTTNGRGETKKIVIFITRVNKSGEREREKEREREREREREK